jgi:hypothetical protein
MSGLAEAADRLVEHVARNAEQQHCVEQRGQDLQPVETERSLRMHTRLGGGLDRRERHAQPQGIGGHVPGVG